MFTFIGMFIGIELTGRFIFRRKASSVPGAGGGGAPAELPAKGPGGAPAADMGMGDGPGIG
ncbi:hypothetical protein KEM56_000827, partial [Ascosphaera pollenicola]